MTTTERRRGVRVPCLLGGYAPCFDDLRYGGGQTLCGLYLDEEVCFHGYIPETCPDCDDGEDWPDQGFDDEGKPTE